MREGGEPAPTEDSAGALEALLREHKILIVCGCGGVGKTTVSASLAVAAARLGRNVAVCTIDPARRLADTLGIAMDHEEAEVDLSALNPAEGGRLTAMMLDTKQTFDRVVTKYAGSEERAERILGNRLYQRISSQVAGSQEYMAMERLHELSSEGRYDLIVLDTPPTRHALDFLNAPERMQRVLDDSSLQWILKPSASAGRFSFGIFKRGMMMLAERVEELIGMSVLHDLGEFFRAFDGMYQGFEDRAKRVRELFREEGSAFVVATTPARQPLHEAGSLVGKLADFGMPLRAVVVNRYHPSLPLASSDGIEEVSGQLGEALRLYAGVVRVEQENLKGAWGMQARQAPFFWIPRLSCDVASLESLAAVADAMTPGDVYGRR